MKQLFLKDGKWFDQESGLEISNPEVAGFQYEYDSWWSPVVEGTKSIRNKVVPGVLYPWDGGWEKVYPRCPRCGYTWEDQQRHGDHHLCGEKMPSDQQVLRLLPKSPVIASSINSDSGGDNAIIIIMNESPVIPEGSKAISLDGHTSQPPCKLQSEYKTSDTEERASIVAIGGIHQNDDTLPADGRFKEVFEKSSLLVAIGGIEERGETEYSTPLTEDQKEFIKSVGIKFGFDPWQGAPERNWEEDFEHENGNYMNVCSTCRLPFKGHKRRVICKMCSEPDWEMLAAKQRPDFGNIAPGAWLEGEMVGFARCMVKFVKPLKEQLAARSENAQSEISKVYEANRELQAQHGHFELINAAGETVWSESQPSPQAESREVWDEMLNYCEEHHISDVRVLEYLMKRYSLTRKP